ncbi:hypothetical protein OYT88_11070 [Sporolactobacillus sp. CQH2019]|uniref:hypothetical protein n=1 Tax=Sporolactobacillus sp. CQH2019 TaxID=3023512 RepID=UPI0023687A42|nr:hypothetical protein [Sporolactobacillus sp. CQH2019]MDD9149093.1 hypothetical protein [Sporolactobacillus sp. CQH2019]
MYLTNISQHRELGRGFYRPQQAVYRSLDPVYRSLPGIYRSSRQVYRSLDAVFRSSLVLLAVAPSLSVVAKV